MRLYAIQAAPDFQKPADTTQASSGQPQGDDLRRWQQKTCDLFGPGQDQVDLFLQKAHLCQLLKGNLGVTLRGDITLQEFDQIFSGVHTKTEPVN